MLTSVVGTDLLRASFLTCRYSFGSGNNATLVEQVLTSRPWWSQSEDENDFNLRWQQLTPPPMRFNSMCSTARKTVFNHLPGNGALHSKISLYQVLLRKVGRTALDFLPVTYILTVPHERDKFRRHFNFLATAISNHNALCEGNEKAFFGAETQPDLTHETDTITSSSEELSVKSKASIEMELSFTPVHSNMKNLWIVKPIGLNRGRGIKVVTSPDEAIAHMKGCQERAREEQVDKNEHQEKTANDVSPLSKIINVNTSMSFIVQKYLETPFLIDGRKFDIRTYALITSDGNGYVYEYGYLRLTSAKYSLDTTDTTVHLTNNAVQKNISGYNQCEDGNMLHFKDLDAYMHSCDNNLSATHFTDLIWPFMKRIMTVVLLSFGKSVLGAHACDGCFELFGFDFMIDGEAHNYRPILIEINSNPCLALSSVVSWDILPKMLDDLMDLTIDKTFPAPRVYRDKLAKLFNDARSGTGKRPITDAFFTGRPDAQVPPTGLRWNALKPGAPVVTRKNLFTRVMHRWKPQLIDAEKQTVGDETKMLHRILEDSTITIFQTEHSPKFHIQKNYSVEDKRPERSETSSRKTSQKKAVLTSRSLSNIPPRCHKSQRDKTTKYRFTSPETSSRTTLTSEMELEE